MAAKKKQPINHNVNINMQDAMVAALDQLVLATGCSTRAELVRMLVREESVRRGIEVGSQPRKKKATTARKRK